MQSPRHRVGGREVSGAWKEKGRHSRLGEYGEAVCQSREQSRRRMRPVELSSLGSKVSMLDQGLLKNQAAPLWVYFLT